MEEGKNSKKTPSNPLSASFKTGAIALVFLVIGYETALFIHRAAQLRVAGRRDAPDTVYVIDPDVARRLLEETPAPPPEGEPVRVRKNASHAPVVEAARERSAPPRRVESFRFNPNTVSAEDLQRLGFSEKQALSILHYREKGGRFRRPSDFAKSYVVADSVYRRLAPYIDIPRIDINRADSALFETLPGIGPYFAGKMVHYREALGGYSCKEQLMEIYHFDREKYDGLEDLITCSATEGYPIWTLPAEQLERHPHISREEARSIVLYRTHQARQEWTLEGLKKAGILSEEHLAGLSRCVLSAP